MHSQLAFVLVLVDQASGPRTESVLNWDLCINDYLAFVCRLPSKHMQNWQTEHIKSHVLCMCECVYVRLCVCACVCIHMQQSST